MSDIMPFVHCFDTVESRLVLSTINLNLSYSFTFNANSCSGNSALSASYSYDESIDLIRVAFDSPTVTNQFRLPQEDCCNENYEASFGPLVFPQAGSISWSCDKCDRGSGPDHQSGSGQMGASPVSLAFFHNGPSDLLSFRITRLVFGLPSGHAVIPYVSIFGCNGSFQSELQTSVGSLPLLTSDVTTVPADPFNVLGSYSDSATATGGVAGGDSDKTGGWNASSALVLTLT